MKRSGLNRRTPLSARNGIKPVGKGGACPPRPAESTVKYDGVEWRRRVFAKYADSLNRLTGSPVGCWMCVNVWGEQVPAQDAHHLLPRQQLVRHLPAEVAAVAVMDPRGGMPLCRDCHGAHHARSQPIPRAWLSDDAQDFADEHGLGWLLEKTYV